MGLDRRMQCFIEQFFPLIWSRYQIPEELTNFFEPSGLEFRDISPALIELLSKAIWVQSKIAFHHWVDFTRMYYDEMVFSPTMFVMYVTYACLTQGYNIQDHYERFVTVCSLLVGFGANFYYNGKGEFLRYIPRILAVFFGRVLSVKFYHRGGWKRLNNYLLQQEYLDWNEEIQIELPNETPQQKVTRELNFAKKVEAAIQASACKDYDVINADEWDSETIQITEEIMRYFSETSPKKKGSKKRKSSATSQPFDEAAAEAKKDVAKGTMEVVQRDSLEALLKPQRLIEEGDVSSGITVNIPFSEAASNVHQTKEMLKQPDDMKIEKHGGNKRKKTKKRKGLKAKDGIPNIPQVIEETYEANVDSGAVSNIINKTEIIVIQKPDNQSEDCASKRLKPIKQKASKTKENNLQSSPLTVEKIKKIMCSDFGDNNESVKAHKQLHNNSEVINDSFSCEDSEFKMGNLKSTEKVNENKELIEDSKLGTEKGFSDSALKDNSENLQKNKCTSNTRTFSMHKNTKNTLQDEGTKTSVIKEQIADNSKQIYEYFKNENHLAVNVSCNVTCSKDASLNSKPNENGSVSNPEPSMERNMQNEILGPKDIGDISANVTSSKTSYAKYNTKREAMNDIIKLVDNNLALKIDRLVDMLGSLVWDLKKES